MVRRVLIVLTLLAFVCAGCGSGEPGTSTSSTASSLLITASDLPGAVTVQSGVPEVCGPVPIVRHNGGHVAVTKMFGLGATKIVEAVGVFAAPAAAETAYEELTSQERRECIAGAIEAFGSGQAVQAGTPTRLLPSRSLSLGDESSIQRYPVGGAGQSSAGVTEVISMRSGRCVATALLLRRAAASSDFSVAALSGAAFRRLRGHCG